MYLRKYLRANKGIVHAHLPRAELFCAAVNLINPLVISKHNSEPFFPKAPKIISKLLALFVSYKSDHCITISQAVADYLTDTNELLTYKSYTVIHYGILDELIEQKNIGTNINISVYIYIYIYHTQNYINYHKYFLLIFHL